MQDGHIDHNGHEREYDSDEDEPALWVSKRRGHGNTRFTFVDLRYINTYVWNSIMIFVLGRGSQMGRKPTITRDELLALAEEIVNEKGPQSLTIDALAKAAGISKGGVQYSFSSKDELISAMLERWGREFDNLLADIDVVGPTEFVRSYIAAMRSPHGAFDSKSAGLMVAYMQNQRHRAQAADRYRATLAKMGKGPENRAARIAYLALEGLFLLRLLGIDKDGEGQASLNDIAEVLDRSS